MELMQINSFYTGIKDGGTIYSAGKQVSVDNYRLILQGKNKWISVIPRVTEPLISFQTANASGQITETFIVQGLFYCRMSDLIARPISELQSIFGTPVYSVTFGGYVLNSDNKIIFVAGINDTLFVTDSTYIYREAGKVSDHFQDYIFVTTTDSNRKIACNKYGNPVECEITIDSKGIPSISQIVTSNLPPELYCLRPTGGYPEQTDSTKARNFIYLNSNFDYLLKANDTTTPYWVSGHVDVTGLPTDSLGTGKDFHYQAVKGKAPGIFLLIDSIDDYADDCKETTVYTYNNRFQLKKTAYSHQALNQSEKSFNIEQTEEKEIEYLWESKQEAAKAAEKTALGLISQSTVKTIQGSVSRYVQKEQKLYSLHSGATGTERIYYTQTNTMDGLDGEKFTQVYKACTFNDNGVPILEESIRPLDQENALRSKYILVKNTALPLAEFKNPSLADATYDGSSSHYLGFAPYESFSIQNNALINDYFAAQNIELISTDFLGSNGLRFQKSGFLRIGDTFTARAGATYIFSCYRRLNGTDKWKYFTKQISGDSLKSNKNIHNFDSGHELCHIMLREISNIAQVHIYDPDTLLQIANLDNTGVITVITYDQLLRPQMEYALELIPDTNSSEDYFLLTNKATLSPVTFKGYSRFNGFNCAKIEITSKLFNSELTAVFFEKANFINRTGGTLSGLSTNTLFAFSTRLISNQTISVLKTNNIQLKIIFKSDHAELRRNEIVVRKSETYVGEATWALFIIERVLLLFVDGKQVLHYVLNRDSIITTVTTEADHTASSFITDNIVISTKMDAEMKYFDYTGNQVQSLKIRNNRLLVSQNIYDRSGNLTVETLPALYPQFDKVLLTSDNPLHFRDGFALFDFSSDTLTGELADFYNSNEGMQYVEYPNDNLWPYKLYHYEDNAGNRLKSFHYQSTYGNKKTVDYQYHNLSIYQNYAANYQNVQNINYSGEEDHMTDGYPNTLFSNQLQDLSGDIYGTQMLGMGNDDTKVLNQVMEKENNIAVSDKTQSPSSFENYFLQGDTAPTMKNSVSTASRLFYSESVDSGIHGALYDSYGNKRLTWNNGDNTFRYFNYDLYGRIVESGTASLTGQLKDYIDKVNNPIFPTNESIPISTSYLFRYDSITPNSENFCLGRLCSVENNSSSGNKITTLFQYDFNGRIIKYNSKSSSSSIDLTYTYEFNSYGKPIKVTYPATLGWQTEYSYNDFGKENAITLKKIDGSKSFTVLQQAQYNIFDELSFYINAQNENVKIKYSMLGNIIEIGAVNQDSAYTTKNFTNWCDPSLPQNLTAHNGAVNTDYSINVDELMRIAQLGIQKSGTTKIQQYKYDLKDNLKFIKIDNNSFTLEYDNNRFIKAQDSTSKTVTNVTYADDGLMKTYSASANFEFARDKFFPHKYAQLYRVSPSSNLYLSYDCYGNKLVEGNTATNGMFYAYSNPSQLEFTYKSDEYGRNSIFIYCGPWLIGEFLVEDQQMLSLMYDEQDTLRYVSFTSDGTVKHKAPEYMNPFGKISGYGTEIPKATFLYNGMQYLEFLGGYDIDGVLYFPEYGVASAPSLNQTYKTPYRPFFGKSIC